MHLTPFESISTLLLGLFLASITTIGLIRAAGRSRPTPATPPAQSTPAAAPAGVITPDLRMCFRKGHMYSDWAKTDTHWVCCRCGNTVEVIVDGDLPYDQDAADLIAETEAVLALEAQLSGGAS